MHLAALFHIPVHHFSAKPRSLGDLHSPDVCHLSQVAHLTLGRKRTGTAEPGPPVAGGVKSEQEGQNVNLLKLFPGHE